MTNKLTKKDFFNAVIALATGLTPAMTSDEIVAAANHELELLAKRTKAGSANPEDATIKDAICEFLATHPDANTSTIGNAIGYSTQKLAPRLSALVKEGVITRATVKGVSRYTRGA